MKQVTFRLVVTTDDDADPDGLKDSVAESIKYLADEGDQLEDFTEYDFQYLEQLDSRDLYTNQQRPKGWISWEDAAKEMGEDYKDIFARELHDGEVWVTPGGQVRWVEDPDRAKEIMDVFGAKDLNDLFGRCHADKNDPIIRELYKCIGYSLYGFWEIFYWDVNNSQAYKYLGRNADALTPVKRMKFQVWVDMDEDMDEDEFDELFDELLEPLEDVEIGGCSVRKVNVYADSDDY